MGNSPWGLVAGAVVVAGGANVVMTGAFVLLGGPDVVGAAVVAGGAVVVAGMRVCNKPHSIRFCAHCTGLGAAC